MEKLFKQFGFIKEAATQPSDGLTLTGKRWAMIFTKSSKDLFLERGQK